MSKITIKTLAEELHLSRNTVSMALKGNAKVSPETRQAVLAHAASVGYPKLLPAKEAASAPSDKPPHILAIRRPDNAIYWDWVINGITEEAALCGCVLNVTVVTQDIIDAMQFPNGYSEDLDACLFLHKFGYPYIKKILSGGKVGIFLDQDNYTEMEPALGDMIKSEGRRSTMELTFSLIRQGMTRIAFFNPFLVSAETFQDRYEGYCDAMRLAGLPIRSEYVITSSRCANINPVITETLNQFSSHWPEAIMCVNDITAMRTSKQLMERGIRIPEDIAITGFDNDENLSFQPFFTTVDCHAKLQGKRMIDQLLWRMQHPDAPFETITLSSQPIYRASSQKRRP